MKYSNTPKPFLKLPLTGSSIIAPEGEVTKPFIPKI